MKLRASPPIPAFSQIALERSDLVFRREHRRAHEAHQVIGGIEECLEAVEVGSDLINSFRLAGQFEQRAGVASGHAGNGLICGCHNRPFINSLAPGLPLRKPSI